MEKKRYHDHEPHEDCDCDLVEIWCDQNRAYRLEGDRGLEKLENLMDVLGYVRSPFRFGSVIEQFLSDNPGAQDAILEFIREWVERSPDWREKMLESVGDFEEEEQ